MLLILLEVGTMQQLSEYSSKMMKGRKYKSLLKCIIKMGISLISKEHFMDLTTIRKNMMLFQQKQLPIAQWLNNSFINPRRFNSRLQTIKMICNLHSFKIKKFIAFPERNIYLKQFSKPSIGLVIQEDSIKFLRKFRKKLIWAYFHYI